MQSVWWTGSVLFAICALSPLYLLTFKEPKCEIDIKNFVNDKYKFEPDLYAKIDVNGANAHPLYKFLKEQKGGTLGE